MSGKKKLNRVEQDLIDGLKGLATDLQGEAPLPEKYTCRRVVLDLAPRVYGPKDVLATRRLLRTSQSLFAQFLGVSTKTVCAWEQGTTPSDMACRFMDEIQRDPDHWRERLLGAAKIKVKRKKDSVRSK